MGSVLGVLAGSLIGFWLGSAGLTGFTGFVFEFGFPLGGSTGGAGLSAFLALWTPNPVVAAMLGVYHINLSV